MSDSLITEIVEITDSSITLSKAESGLEESNKRRLSNDDESGKESVSGKKICRETDNFEDSSLIIEQTLSESLNEDTTQLNEDESNLLEKSIVESKLDSEIINSSLEEDPSTLLEEEISDEMKNDQNSLTENKDASNYGVGSSDEDDYDDSIMMRAMSALPKQSSNHQKSTNDEELIELNSDTDEDIADDENNDDSIEEVEDGINDTEEDDEEEQENVISSLNKRMMRYNPKFYFARKLVRKSIKVLLHRKANTKKEMLSINDHSNEKESDFISEIQKNIDEKLSKDVKSENLCNDEIKKIKNKKNDKQEQDNEMSIKNSTSKTAENDLKEQKNVDNHNQTNDNNTLEKSDTGTENYTAAECPKMDESNTVEENSLLNEISSLTVDQIMDRYVFCNGENNSLAIDDFSEQLFYCLQENKKQIEEIQRVWNEKVHLKFKIREIMEKIRRQRVISEIETFGIKPSHENNQPCNILSSKSSTTNSENEHFARSSSKMSSQSVNRLIRDVRENVLKKDKNKFEDAISRINVKYDEGFDDCTSFGLNSLFQSSSSSQGRQGQTVDVQSIINDFRQKNPQEIPRRGRRMKSSFSNNFLISNQLQASNKVDDKTKASSLEQNSSMKSNASAGFPEVSLLPVNNFYKNHSPQLGQKSSLLQSILTKQPNKSPLTVQSNNKSSTLARLLTAPEKSFQSPSRSILQHSSKVHNNGEITITPIAGTSRRQLIDDEENSDPPLVIDESDDFEISDRHNTTSTDLLCQGCRRNKALFMCAGCSRQWYCSKECQELAWDDHAESCMV